MTEKLTNDCLERMLEGYLQCDQIGQFIGLKATFQSLWQQLICPNLLHFSSEINFGQLL